MEQERKNIIEVELSDDELDGVLKYQEENYLSTVQDAIHMLIQFHASANTTLDRIPFKKKNSDSVSVEYWGH